MAAVVLHSCELQHLCLWGKSHCWNENRFTFSVFKEIFFFSLTCFAALIALPTFHHLCNLEIVVLFIPALLDQKGRRGRLNTCSCLIFRSYGNEQTNDCD